MNKFKLDDPILLEILIEMLGITRQELLQHITAQMRLGEARQITTQHREHSSLQPDGRPHTSERIIWTTPACYFETTKWGRVSRVKTGDNQTPVCQWRKPKSNKHKHKHKHNVDNVSTADNIDYDEPTNPFRRRFPKHNHNTHNTTHNTQTHTPNTHNTPTITYRRKRTIRLGNSNRGNNNE